MFCLILTVLLLSHWIGDFLLQTPWMRANKSKQMLPLILHSGVIFFTMLVAFAIIFLIMEKPITWYTCLVITVGSFINAVTHCFIDGISSRLTSQLYERKDYQNFFNVIGLDQVFHLLILISMVVDQ